MLTGGKTESLILNIDSIYRETQTKDFALERLVA